MKRVVLYIIIGLLCLAMAGGIFLGGPSTPARNEAGQAAQGPAAAPLTADDEAGLERRREVARSLIAKAGADPAALTDDTRAIGAIQAALDAEPKDKRYSTWELQALGVVFGDALAKASKLQWVMIKDGGRSRLALMEPASGAVMSPQELFTGPVERPIDVSEAFDALTAELAKLKATAPQEGG